jgi:hypothetical protein
MTNAMMLLVRILIAAFAAATIVYAWHWYMRDTTGLLLGFLLAAPIAVRLLARPVMDFAREGWPWLGRRPAAREEGRSFEFDSVPVRVQQHELGVRFRAEDVAAATRLQGIPWQGRGYVDLATLEKWLGKRREPAAERFLAWARKKR